MKNNIYFFKKISTKLADNITFIVTDSCNLKCRYCYEKDKQSNNMSFDTAKKAVDYFIDEWNNRYDKVIFDFIGGEPFICIDLLEKILPYIVKKLNNQQKWKEYVFSFTTNGTYFFDKRVRNLLETYRNSVSVGLSLDGCKEIHDYNRNNSFDEVMKWFPYWKEKFPWSTTKSTINHEALPYLFESIKFLTNTCLQEIFINTVFEDVWYKDDDKLFFNQLIKCADYILDNKMYKYKYISLFDPYLIKDFFEENHNWCGCGSSMIAVDFKGDLFPCLRFKTLSKKEPLVIGNIFVDNGKIDYKKLLPFYFCHNIKNTPGCKNCDYRNGCPNCTAFCYDETGSIFDRVGYMCKMHKARVKANKYYWNKMAKIEGITLEKLILEC